MYTFEQLKEDVRKEAEALKVHATKEELKHINLKDFDPTSYSGCIYGMCTGDCHSERAAELIELCCVRFFRSRADGTSGFTAIRYEGLEGLIKRVNGAKVDDFTATRTSMTTPTHFSAIEAYILLPEANNANLIAFLRGEAETLEL
jgi:hypothetical protein